MDTPQVDDFLMMAAALVGAIAVISGGLLALYRFLTSAISKRLDGIDSQLKRNGGSSLRDAVDRIEERQGEMRDYVVRTADRLDEHITWHLDKEKK
ncbi:MAG TPA: hypothetical protein VIG24_14320 [Acidimicrobiia bacterium]|jgi:hypothetical protein